MVFSDIIKVIFLVVNIILIFSLKNICFNPKRAPLSTGHSGYWRYTNASYYYHIIFQKIFRLPSVTTIRRTLAKLEIYPGFPSSILEAFKVKVVQIEPNDRLCVLVFDEMSLKCALHYNVERDNAEGLEDFRLTCGRTEKPAIMLIMLNCSWLAGCCQSRNNLSVIFLAIQLLNLQFCTEC